MSAIVIRKCSITEPDTDAVVNAANEGLRAGSGVCGVIFAAAGHALRKSACDAIGHCDTGSAVITPGFDLKAAHIIHAVGPVWEGGRQGEDALLFQTYARALALAAENGCGSVAFPLISAGIFGYPADRAWQIAIRSCGDFLRDGGALDIVFAVLNDSMLELGQRTLAELRSEYWQFKEGLGWKACRDILPGRFTAEYGGSGAYHLYEINEDIFAALSDGMREGDAVGRISAGRHLYMDVNDRCGPPYTVVFDDDYRALCPWAGIVGGEHVWPKVLTDAAVELFASERANREYRRKKQGGAQ